MTIVAKHLKIQSSKLMNSLFLGNFKAAFHGKGIEFRDFREYNSGDDAKHIDWLRSSTEGTTIMRRYREEKEGNILAVVDTRESLKYPDGAQKIKCIQDIIDLLGSATISSGESFGGYILSQKGKKYVRPKKTRQGILELQKIPTSLRQETDILNLGFLLQKDLKRSIVFVISDTRNIDLRSFKIAAKKHDIIYIHVSSFFENTLNQDGISYLKSRYYGVAADMSDSIKKEKYISARKKILSVFSGDLRRIGIDSLFLDEQSSLFGEFLKLMKLRAKK